MIMWGATLVPCDHLTALPGAPRLPAKSTFASSRVRNLHKPVYRKHTGAARSGGRGEHAPPSCSDTASNRRKGVHEAYSRRSQVAALVLTPAAAVLSPLLTFSATPARAGTPGFTSAGGIEYYDRVIGDGGAAIAGDLIRIVFTAHTYDPEGVEKDSTFDPFGSGGSSTTKGYKYLLGQHDSELPPGETNPPLGFERGIMGGEGVEPMKKGGSRVIRMPAGMAYGDDGHHCKYGVKTACEVPPGSPVEFEVQFIEFV